MFNAREIPRTFFTLLLFLTSQLPIAATVIVQKNGDVISGKILEEKADKYIFQSPYGKLQVAKNSISNLILDEKTIELKDVEFKNKKVKARIVSEEKNSIVYLTEDGQTIRKENAAATIAAPSKPVDRQKILLGIAGTYGFSTFQQVDTGPSTTGPRPLEQSMHLNTLGAQVSAHYTFTSWIGAGACFSFYRWQGAVSLMPQQGQQLAYDANTGNSSLAFLGSVVFSPLRNLGSKTAVHDFRVELQAGPSINTADMELVFKNAQNFPPSATAAGRVNALSLQTSLSYAYSISEALRLRVGLVYYRALYKNIYSNGLQSGGPIPGQFKPDFEKVLTLEGQNPQVVGFQLGAEFGF